MFESGSEWKCIFLIDFVRPKSVQQMEQRNMIKYRLKEIICEMRQILKCSQSKHYMEWGRQFDRHNSILTTRFGSNFSTSNTKSTLIHITTTQFFDILYYNNKYSILIKSFDETTLHLFNWYYKYKISLKIATVTFSLKRTFS